MPAYVKRQGLISKHARSTIGHASLHKVLSPDESISYFLVITACADPVMLELNEIYPSNEESMEAGEVTIKYEKGGLFLTFIVDEKRYSFHRKIMKSLEERFKKAVRRRRTKLPSNL